MARRPSDETELVAVKRPRLERSLDEAVGAISEAGGPYSRAERDALEHMLVKLGMDEEQALKSVLRQCEPARPRVISGLDRSRPAPRRSVRPRTSTRRSR